MIGPNFPEDSTSKQGKQNIAETPSKKSIIVGAGFGGLAMGLRLRRLGYEVTIIDNNPMAGGRAQVYRKKPTSLTPGPR